ncbi:hypothetical protein O3P69_009074 [Scylla paramamosain]|uniref:Uncharacterized protein n=1 Tax=Scylla paramamosain TaxID=85552 RepID=A0AAW0TU65_SCYPA
MTISQPREPGITERRSVVRGRLVTVSTFSYRDEKRCNRLLSALLSASPHLVLAKSATWLLECTGRGLDNAFEYKKNRISLVQRFSSEAEIVGTALRALQEHSRCRLPNTSQMMQGVATSSLGSVESPVDAGGLNTNRSTPLSALRTNLERGKEEDRPEGQGWPGRFYLSASYFMVARGATPHSVSLSLVSFHVPIPESTIHPTTPIRLIPIPSPPLPHFLFITIPQTPQYFPTLITLLPPPTPPQSTPPPPPPPPSFVPRHGAFPRNPIWSFVRE